ncbi:MAG: DUF2783 domain-containing protein [Pseudomonadota bacterium]
MAGLNLDPNLRDADKTYAEILAAHDGLSFEESAALNARLILILTNHIGDADVLKQAVEAAKQR